MFLILSVISTITILVSSQCCQCNLISYRNCNLNVLMIIFKNFFGYIPSAARGIIGYYFFVKQSLCTQVHRVPLITVCLANIL